MAAFTPGGYGIDTSYNYVSTYDIHMAQWANKLVPRYGNQLLTDLFGQYGKKIAVSGLEYNHAEEDRIMPKIKATTAGAGANAAATFTLASTTPTQNVSLPQASPYIGTTLTSQGVPVREKDLLLIRPSSGTASLSTYIWASVSSVNTSAGTFVASPIVSGESIPAISTAQEIVIFSNAHGEGSGQPASFSTRVKTYTNNLQIIKENYKISNTEKDVEIWFEVTGENGKTGKVFTIKGEGDTYKRFLNQRELGMLIGKKMTNTTLADVYSANPVKMTNGLLPEIIANGTNSTYSAISGWTITDGYNLVKAMDKEKAAKENWLMAGINLSINIDNEMRTTFQNGGIQFNSFNGSQEQAVNLAFSSFRLGEYTFHKKTYDVFNDVQTLGAVGYNFPNEGFVIPMDKVRDYTKGASMPMADSLRIRHLAAPGGDDSRDMNHVAVNMFNVTGEDAYDCRYASEIGFEGFALNRFAYIQQG